MRGRVWRAVQAPDTAYVMSKNTLAMYGRHQLQVLRRLDRISAGAAWRRWLRSGEDPPPGVFSNIVIKCFIETGSRNTYLKQNVTIKYSHNLTESFQIKRTRMLNKGCCKSVQIHKIFRFCQNAAKKAVVVTVNFSKDYEPRPTAANASPLLGR